MAKKTRIRTNGKIIVIKRNRAGNRSVGYIVRRGK